MAEPGSVGSAANIYQKLVPQPVRAVAASKVPPSVRGKVKRRLARTLANRESRHHQRALKRVREEDFSYLPEGTTTAPDGRVAHIHSGLTPELSRRTDHYLVSSVLDNEGIPWFAVPALDDRRIAIAVPQEHKASVSRVMRALLEVQTGYVIGVSPSNTDGAKIPGSHVKAWANYAKQRVIRLVWLRTDPTRTLWIGDDLGIEIEFWTVNNALETPRLVGPRPNRVQRVVPAEGGGRTEVTLDRLTGYADIGSDGEITVTHEGFDIPRVEEITFGVDAVLLWQHATPWAEELLRAALRSIHQNAPWIDMVHVVALAPLPDWVRIDDRLSVWSADWNAETGLHRIPGLSDQFLLMRPGALFTRPVRAFDFFSPLGGTRPRRGPWNAEEAEAPWSLTAYSYTHTVVGHGYASGPQPYAREVLAALSDTLDPGAYVVDTQVAPELTGTHPLDGLIHHAAHSSGFADPSGEPIMTLHAALPGIKRHLERLLVRRDTQCLQLSGLGSAEARTAGGTSLVVDFLQRYFPVPSPFEQPSDQAPEQYAPTGGSDPWQ
ncbi:sugar phosphotransferase [Streptomyces sp. NPDC059447]|uniref:sugar phosphotransferase n=1 Tax=Streptomyces sp. NPDC059447 TaxID=3346834 RepID=UPI0036ACA4D5